MIDYILNILMALAGFGIGLILLIPAAEKVVEERVCAVRWEYVVTPADSLALYREHPVCAEHIPEPPEAS